MWKENRVKLFSCVASVLFWKGMRQVLLMQSGTLWFWWCPWFCFILLIRFYFGGSVLEVVLPGAKPVGMLCTCWVWSPPLCLLLLPLQWMEVLLGHFYYNPISQILFIAEKQTFQKCTFLQLLRTTKKQQQQNNTNFVLRQQRGKSSSWCCLFFWWLKHFKLLKENENSVHCSGLEKLLSFPMFWPSK